MSKSSNILSGEGPHRVIIIQSASRALRPVLSWLRGMNGNLDVDVLVPPGASDKALVKEERINRIPLHGDGFDAEKIDSEQLNRLRQNEYDLAIVLLNNVLDCDYRNVETFAGNLNASEILGFDANANKVFLDGLSKCVLWLKRYVNRYTTGLMGIVYGACLIVTFIPGLVYRVIRNRLFPPGK